MSQQQARLSLTRFNFTGRGMFIFALAEMKTGDVIQTLLAIEVATIAGTKSVGQWKAPQSFSSCLFLVLFFFEEQSFSELQS